MLGLSVAPDRRCGSPLAPRRGFWPRRIKAPEGASCTMPEEPAPRNGLSLPRSGCLFRSHLSGIIAPGLLLQHLAASYSNPFGLGLPSSSRIRGAGRIITPDPLSEPEGHNLKASSRLAPPRVLSNPPVRRSARFSFAKLTLPPPPVPSLPESAFLTVCLFGSPLRNGRPRLGSLFREPLGTIPILQQTAARCQPHTAKNPGFCTNFIFFVNK